MVKDINYFNEQIDNGKKINDGTNNGGELYLNGDVLYKTYDGDTCFISERERNISFLKEKKLFRPYIIDTYYDKDNFVGYSQEFIKNSTTFKDGINDEALSFDDKVGIVNDVLTNLKLLHDQDIYLGDIHSKNFIYNDEGGFIIDLDEIRFKDKDEFKFMECYLIREHDDSNMLKKADRYTDNVKTTISALSFLYGFDFEEVAKNHSLDTIKDCLDVYITDDEFREDVDKVFDNKKEIVYFDDVLNKYNNRVNESHHTK